jgi:tRNA-dihydrouridine synthase B
MRIRGLVIDPPVALAPLSGITDLSFRTVCREMGARLAYTGLISANALRYQSAKTMGLLRLPAHDHPVAAQVFGAEPDLVAAAAAIAAESGADIVDINMGCTVPKVVKAGAGTALMADPERAVAMVAAVVSAVGPTPVGVKMRSGWRDRGANAVELARRFEQAGASAIAIHPRWAGQGFRGAADWAVIGRVKDAVSLPVIGSGDIHGAADAVRMMRETGCDGVMIGRAALGNPWVFAQAAAAIGGDSAPPSPPPEERVAVAEKHLALIIADRGENVGAREMRKHIAWYLKGMPNAAALRDRANRARTEAELRATLEEARHYIAAHHSREAIA